LKAGIWLLVGLPLFLCVFLMTIYTITSRVLRKIFSKRTFKKVRYIGVLIGYFVWFGVKQTILTSLRTLQRFITKIRNTYLLQAHLFFEAKYTWYQRYHAWRLKRAFHGFVLSVYVLSTFGVVIVNLSRTFAGDLTDVWDFSNSNNYVADSGLEVVSNQARMRAQNYATDANTVGLFHFDEVGGSSATDSSTEANNGTITGGTFVLGNLNNALDLNGTSGYVAVPDSPALSFSQSNTIEAWTKLDTAMSPSTASQSQSIVSKGDYSLYYDNETGKVTYELANSATNSWTRYAGNDTKGSWDVDGKRNVNSSVTMGTSVFAGLGDSIGDAEVWQWNGTAWTKIGGDGLNSSWADQTYEMVYTLETDGTNVYAGLGASTGDGEVWRWNGTAWTKIGGDGINSGWAAGTYEYVTSLDFYNTFLYAGLGSSADDAEVWRWNGTAWTKIGGDGINSGWGAGYEYVHSLVNDGTNLYAGLGASADDAEVWRWNSTAWTKIGGDSINSGWTTGYEEVRSMYWQGGFLYAGIGNSANDAEVWRWNGTAWTKIGGDSINSGWTTNYEIVASLVHDGTNLYAGLGNSDTDGEVWRWNGTAWTKIGGDSLNGSWNTQGDSIQNMTFVGSVLYAGLLDANGGPGYMYSWNGTTWTVMGGQYINKSWGYNGVGSVEVLYSARDRLYAGIGSAAGSAQVWEYNGTTDAWVMVGGQGINSSWTFNTYELITSMNSYGGNLVVGLGNSADDAEVWSYNGTAWTKIGGDSINSGWTTGYEEVNALANYGGFLYAGLGNSANDAEVWRWNGTAWTKIGGDSINSGWTTNYERVSSLAVYNGQLHAGLGVSAGDGEIWRWNGTAWTKIGGDGLNSGFDATIEQVESMIVYNNRLYAGLGNTAGDADLWEWDGTTWTKIGGDDLNGSWTSGTYETVSSLATYNGELYVGLGNSTGDGEAWKWDGTTWLRIGGVGINNGWSNVIEEVKAIGVYQGRLFAGTGNSANVDAAVWSWGNNGYLQSTTSSFDTSWRHIAATYDGATMRLYINGVLNSSRAVSLSIPDSTRPLLIGTSYGGREQGGPQSYFDGQIDELRLSNTARSSFTTTPYSTTPQVLSLATAALTAGVGSYDVFAPLEITNGGTITYRLSDNDGNTWKYWNGSAWVTSANVTEANAAAVINTNINTFPVTFYGLKWQAILRSDGNQRVTLDELTIESNSDVVNPSANASAIQAYKANGGTALASNDWTNGASPYFTWTAGTDADSGIKGYCLYLGQDNMADPVTTKGLLGTSPVFASTFCQFMVSTNSVDFATPGLIGTPLTTSSSPYYLRIKAIDNAGNVFPTSAQFQFRFDNTPPTNPGFITAPSGFINTKETTLTWPTTGGSAASDGSGSGLAGLQYRINNTVWYGDAHTGSGDMSDLLANDGAYTTITTPDFANINEGINTIYFRTWDQAGNVTSSLVTATLKVNTSGAPSEPQNLAAIPTTNTSNAFSFDWDAPTTFVGDVNNITYCYTVNTLPSAGSCSYTSAGATALGSGPYATQPGSNTLYVVARDESNNINYSSYASVSFTANTPAPGVPTSTDIVDVSIKTTSKWRLALTWEEPTYVGSGVSNYRVYRSTDNVTFNFVGSSSSTTYIDGNLTQQLYYYYVRACDNTNNCGANSSTVSLIPTGRFTDPATLTSNPQVSNITTKRATISWTTDRASDSKVAIGTSSGQYGSSEIGNSDQVAAHTLELNNLAAGTTYYYVAKWTDEDGNTGTSQEFTFTTAPAPIVRDIETVSVGLTTASVNFTVSGATKVNMYFGLSDSFGGLKSINTSFEESQYTFNLDGLNDGSKYFYRISAFDSEGGEYLGNIFSFNTPARPRITNLRFQPVEGEPTSTQLVTWQTNVASTSAVNFGLVGGSGTNLQDSDLKTEHQIKIKDLIDNSEYFVVAQSRDKDGNLASSDRQQFRTALDTRPPKVFDVSIESSIRGTGAEARGQVIVSWKTDEPSMSQVGYSEGSNATVFNSKTAEDATLTTEHLVIVSDLPTSRVYSIQAISKDSAGNVGLGNPQSAIIGRASENVLTIILNTLQNVFGF
jgi:hypothetical protein